MSEGSDFGLSRTQAILQERVSKFGKNGLGVVKVRFDVLILSVYIAL